MRIIAPSELIINGDGSIFHLHLKPGQLADTVILVGDPGRVEQVAAYFDSVECRAENREFVAVTGECFGKRMTVQSTGIGTDNIDIVVNELDALANIDFETRTEKAEKTRLTLVRLGTCGGIQPELKIGDLVLSRISAGFDGLLNFYKGRNAVCDLEMEQDFVEHTGWSRLLTAPYFVRCSDRLAELFADRTVEGMTISAPGFMPAGPLPAALAGRSVAQRQDRIVRIPGTALYQFRNGRFGAGRTVSAAGARRRHDLHGYRTASCPRNGTPTTGLFVDKMIKMSLEKLAGL